MNAGLLITDATRKISATDLVLRSSVAAATPSQQHYNLALKEKVKWKWSSSHRRVSPRGAADSTSRRDAAAPRGGTRAVLPRSISSVAAASTLSQQRCRRRQCPATMSGRRGLFFWNCSAFTRSVTTLPSEKQMSRWKSWVSHRWREKKISFV